MMKVKYLAAALVAFGAALSLASCSKVSQSYADKVMKDLGKEAVDLTIGSGKLRSGVIYAVKGCKSWDDIQKKIDDGKDVEGLVITILGGVATAAAYQKITGK